MLFLISTFASLKKVLGLIRLVVDTDMWLKTLQDYSNAG